MGRERSQANVEVLMRLVDAINAGPIPRELIAPDFELTNVTTAVADASYSGYEGGLQWRRDIFDVFDEPRFEVLEILAEGPEHVVASNRLVGRGSSSGAPLELRWTSVFWFREGKLARVIGYQRRRDALAAVERLPPT
jgi:ketosteroid isomerase-like protein